MTDPPLKISNSSKGRPNYFSNFKTLVAKNGTVNIQKTAVLSRKATSSLETKSKADLALMKKYGMVPGSLKKAFSDKSGNINFAVQVKLSENRSVVTYFYSRFFQ
jgi:hypothetical protein